MNNLSIIPILFILLIGCNSPESGKEGSEKAVKDQKNDESSTWKSKYHEFEAEFSSPWEALPTLSKPHKTLFALIDKNDGKSYIVKITDDVSKEELSDSAYYGYFIDLNLEKNSFNKLVDEREVVFHGKTFHRFIFVLRTKQWGVLTQHAFFRRTGELLYSVQMSFPTESEEHGTLELPKEHLELDSHILIEGK